MTMSPAILGWDIGGVNTKVARLEAGRRWSRHPQHVPARSS